MLYILWLNLAGGGGWTGAGLLQSPVAAAAAIAFAAVRRESGHDTLRWSGCAAMLLFGVALQIKYSAVFESMFVGLLLVAKAWRSGRTPASLVLDMALWMSIALFPTILSALAYWRMGHLNAWWFANATSILLRQPEAPEVIRDRILAMCSLVVPLLLCIPLRRWLGCRPSDPRQREELRLIDMWAAAALLGVVLFGTWFNHYALPLFAPFAAAAAPLWRRRAGKAVMFLLLIAGYAIGEHTIWHH